jgi:hypothetical protein
MTASSAILISSLSLRNLSCGVNFRRIERRLGTMLNPPPGNAQKRGDFRIFSRLKKYDDPSTAARRLIVYGVRRPEAKPSWPPIFHNGGHKTVIVRGNAAAALGFSENTSGRGYGGKRPADLDSFLATAGSIVARYGAKDRRNQGVADRLAHPLQGAALREHRLQ